MYGKFMAKQKPTGNTGLMSVSKGSNTSSGEEKYLWFLFLVEAAAHRHQATQPPFWWLPDVDIHSLRAAMTVACSLLIFISWFSKRFTVLRAAS